MTEVIGVKFKSGGKMYYFAPGDLNPAEGSYVVVETARGPECGEVAARRHAVPDDSVTAPLKPMCAATYTISTPVMESYPIEIESGMKITIKAMVSSLMPNTAPKMLNMIIVATMIVQCLCTFFRNSRIP